MKIGIAFASIVVLLAVWWLWPQRVELNESEYDFAMALYRVCNQSSDEGLIQIETLLDQEEQAHPSQEPSPLRPIIAAAKSGQWRDAAKACRQVLDDQVEH
ncbi:hypothetical protein [Allorhodopirellula solitaria]|uniref:Uncharacterized protein n=1 Tax=Allorhodopirellula solitaria TaxID=2527987 RepID=A0A5C5XVP4_9BACT|nr:hypothetical protein [Allorhodopirellula solitaria]TWT66473.1 hypothetical protein CA85_25680 [Allorhodopirellula solitaria]